MRLTFEHGAPAEAEVTKGFGRSLEGPVTLGGDPKLGCSNARLGFARHVIPPQTRVSETGYQEIHRALKTR